VRGVRSLILSVVSPFVYGDAITRPARAESRPLPLGHDHRGEHAVAVSGDSAHTAPALSVSTVLVRVPFRRLSLLRSSTARLLAEALGRPLTGTIPATSVNGGGI
jgi:hypothetical protein